MAKMRGHIGVGGRCHVEGHGQHCELGRETTADRMERAREKRQWLREKWEAISANTGGGDWDRRLASEHTRDEERS